MTVSGASIEGDYVDKADPAVPDWCNIDLPNTWVDALDFKKPADLYFFLKRVFSRQSGKVKLMPEMMGESLVPKYALQEFHDLPNGNYSNNITRGYGVGFDKVMLGTVVEARQCIAENYKHLNSVLDIGCGAGHVANAVSLSGVKDVWAVDPSPYLLKIANGNYPNVNFIQGIQENLNFSEGRFDGIAYCFVLHEIPPKYIQQGLLEAYRVLIPGGLLYICEPSPKQRNLNYKSVLREYGIRGVYFKWLSHSVSEPYADAWHKFSQGSNWFTDAGFDLISDEDKLPLRHIILRKPEN